MDHTDLWLKNHNAVRVQCVQKDVVRIRYNASGMFEQSLTERYDIIKTCFEDTELHVEQSEDSVRIVSGEFTIHVSPDDGTMTFGKADGGILVRNIKPFAPREDRGVGGIFAIEADERFYGGGYRPQETIECRGMLLKNLCTYNMCNGPSPYFMSSRGWGVFWNTTYEHYFDIGTRNPNEMVLWSEDGEFDIFLFAGSLRHMIGRYTDITGKPMLLPLFGYGLTCVHTEIDTEYTLLEKAERFRKEEIPCDIFSLTCEWSSKRYDQSVEQAWNKQRYFVNDWMWKERTFVHALAVKGIKTVLWTACDYDLTYEEERRYREKHPEDQKESLYKGGASFKFREGHILDEHFVNSIRQDPYTVPEEAWVDHYKKFFDIGVVGIAEDGANVQNLHIDKCYGNGRTYKEMHNLNQTLNAKQYNLGYRKHCGKRIMVRTPSTYIGHQKWTGTWCGDVHDKTPIMGMIKYSFQGEMNVTADMNSKNIEGMHLGFLMPWTMHFSWADTPQYPWYSEDRLKNAYKFYAKLRYSLLPYIYSAAWQGHCTGLTISRAMVLMYPDDERTYNMIKQYMFGDWLLVGALSDTVYLPEGRWIDYWTGVEYEGKQDIASGYPEDRGGYLFIKKGAIIPYWPPVNYVGEKVIETITLRIYPYGESSFTLYEDDGESFEYEKGAYATTDIRCSEKDGIIDITIGQRQGTYEGMPDKRNYDIEVYCPRPRSVSADEWRYDEEKGAVMTAVREQKGGLMCNISLE